MCRNEIDFGNQTHSITLWSSAEFPKREASALAPLQSSKMVTATLTCIANPLILISINSFSSCHPPYRTRSIPYSRALRIRRLVFELRAHLICKDYKSKNNVFNIASIIQYKQKESNHRTLCVVTFHPNMPTLSTIFRKHWSITESLDVHEKVIPCQLILAYRKQ